MVVAGVFELDENDVADHRGGFGWEGLASGEAGGGAARAAGWEEQESGGEEGNC